MTQYELLNSERKYFGLTPVNTNWEKCALGDTLVAYFDEEKIVKIINYNYGYLEYDTNIDTRDRLFILPKTLRGKEQKLTIAKLCKIKGSGIQFSGSFEGGGIHIYNNKRNALLTKSFPEENYIKSFEDISNWISDYISKTPVNYFDWLDEELTRKKQKIKVNQGDIVAFKISKREFGFASVLSESYGLYKSLIIAPYAYYSDTLQIDIDNLITKKTLPAIRIFDVEIYRGTMPVIGNRSLSEIIENFQHQDGYSFFLTVPYTKKDIDTFIANNY